MSTIEIAGHSANVVGDRGASDSPLVILLHGYGAPGDDLVPLSREIASPPGTRFVFPHGSINLDAIAGYRGARAWWPIDMMQLQVAMMTGQLEELANQLLPGLRAAVADLSRLVTVVCSEFNAPMERVVLGGFSQGAILALATALENDWKLGGLLLFSPTLLDREVVRAQAKVKSGQACVLSHGQVDPILPFASTQTLSSLLVDSGWDVTWVPFMGGHGIPPAAVAAAGRLIARTAT